MPQSTAVFCPKIICVVSRMPFYRYGISYFSSLLKFMYSVVLFFFFTI